MCSQVCFSSIFACTLVVLGGVAAPARERVGGSSMKARSSGAEHYLDTVGVGGSNPPVPMEWWTLSMSNREERGGV